MQRTTELPHFMTALLLLACGGNGEPSSAQGGSGGVGGSNGGAGTSGGSAGAPAGSGGASGTGNTQGGTSGSGNGGKGGVSGAAAGGVPQGGSGGTAGSGNAGGASGSVGAAGKAGASGMAGASGANTVPIFIAQGHMGRLTISCDDGKSWQANHSSDESARCFQGGLDCDHGSGAGRGLAYGNGWFVATFGWGTPGNVQRSRDGVTWQSVTEDTEFADIAFGNGSFIANRHMPQLSTDGATWKDGGSTQIGISTMRAIEFIPYQGGRFIIVAEDDPTREIVVSSDAGKSWQHAQTSPAECVKQVTGISFGNGVTVAVGGKGIVCRSPDGGDTWTLINVTNGRDLTSPPLWDGERFLVWGDNVLYRSVDGQTWTSTAGTPSSAHIGPVARSPDGTFVAALWDGEFYGEQEFYRSVDGITWQALAKDKFMPSHPIRFMQFGYATPSSVCPSP